MSDAVLALRQQINDTQIPSMGGIDTSNARAASEKLRGVQFITTGGGGNIRVLMNANRKLVKVAIRPGSIERHGRRELTTMIRTTIHEAETILQETFDSLKVNRVG